MSSDSDIIMQGSITSDINNKDNLLEGAARRSNPPKTAWESGSPQIKLICPIHQLVVSTERAIKYSESMDDEALAKALSSSRKEIVTQTVNGTEVIIVPFETQNSLEVAKKRNPLMNLLEHKEVEDQNTKKEWVKIRQWPVQADIEQIMSLNELLGWHGKVYPTRPGKKYTTAILKAPSEIEAAKLLEKGHIVDNGNLMAVVPSDSTRESEEQRTILMVGINKTQEKLLKAGNKLTEIGLLKSLVKNGYPIQSLKLVAYDQSRIGHSAYVLMRSPTPANEIPPFQDSISGTIIKWAEVAEYDKICEKCLSWPEHLTTCSKHENNAHRYINGNQIAKKAKGETSLILKRIEASRLLKKSPP